MKKKDKNNLERIIYDARKFEIEKLAEIMDDMFKKGFITYKYLNSPTNQ